MRKNVLAIAAALGALSVVAAVSAQELVVDPGWTDGFFDGSDHQTSGIDVYIPEPDWGSIPPVPPPTPVEDAEGMYEKTTPEMSDLVETPDPRLTDTQAAAYSRILAIRYLDSSVQLVPLVQTLRNVARMRAVSLSSTPAGASRFLGRWNSRDFGRITVKQERNVLKGTATRRGLKFEGVLVGPSTIDGTWCDSSRRHGRIVISLSPDGRSLAIRRLAGVSEALPGSSAAR